MAHSTRTLSNGAAFGVVTLPKGTVLFHGFQGDYNGYVNENKIFSELFGDPNSSGHHCVTNHTQKFFYPAPFMADVVYKFQVYAIFILNYDVNLVSMILPDRALHSNKGSLESATIRCATIAKADACDLEYKSSDHCLTPQLLREHPDIHGYIAIPNTDGSLYKSAFYPQLKHTYANYTRMTTPMVVSDKKGLTAIPEIVLHPYHVRTDAPRTISPRAAEDQIMFTIKNMSLLNYVPIMYFNESRTFSFLDLADKKTRYDLLSIDRDMSMKAITPIHQRVKAFLDTALSPGGVKIHDMNLKITVDVRTGFYFAKHRIIPPGDSVTTNINVYRETDDSEMPTYDVVPFSYPANMKKQLHGLLSSTHPAGEGHLTRELARIQASYRRKYIFDKGQSYRTFEMENSFPFHALKNKTRKVTSPQNYRRAQTRKRPR
jgi:hypothetical protein